MRSKDGLEVHALSARAQPLRGSALLVSTASWGSRQYLSQRKAIGLGGRDRKMGDSPERARSAVTWRIRHAIKKLAVVYRALARHLRVSLKTGVFLLLRAGKRNALVCLSRTWSERLRNTGSDLRAQRSTAGIRRDRECHPPRAADLLAPRRRSSPPTGNRVAGRGRSISGA